MKDKIIVPVYENEYIQGKTTLKIDVAFLREAASHRNHFWSPNIGNTKIMVSQSSQNNPEITCEISLSNWVQLRSIIRLTSRDSDFNKPFHSVINDTVKFEEIRKTTVAVYCAIRIQSGMKLSFEQQIACQRLLTYDCNNLPSCVKESVISYKEGLATARAELHSIDNAKARVLFFPSGSSSFALYYSPLHNHGERFAPWELQLAYRRTASSKPQKGLPIAMTQEHLAMIINQVDTAIDRKNSCEEK